MKPAWETTNANQDAYLRARKRVAELKGFYIHLGVYLLINSAGFIVLYSVSRDKGESFWQAGHFFPFILWGIGLLFHAAHTFRVYPNFGKKWEERQIRKYMSMEDEESNTFQK